jgi:iron complex outermembrane recepter protein
LLGKTERWGDISASGVLSYVNGKNETTGDNLYNIMPLNARLSLDQKSGNWSNNVELKLVDAKTMVSSVRQEVSTAGYGLVNLHSSYELKTVRYNFGIENLFNQFYYLPLGGAYTGQGVTMSTNGVSWGVPVPGMGRSVNASVTVKF